MSLKSPSHTKKKRNEHREFLRTRRRGGCTRCSLRRIGVVFACVRFFFPCWVQSTSIIAVLVCFSEICFHLCFFYSKFLLQRRPVHHLESRGRGWIHDIRRSNCALCVCVCVLCSCLLVCDCVCGLAVCVFVRADWARSNCACKHAHLLYIRVHTKSRLGKVQLRVVCYVFVCCVLCVVFVFAGL